MKNPAVSLNTNQYSLSSRSQLLSEIPVVGASPVQRSVLVYLMLCGGRCAGILLIFRSRWGLRLRAGGTLAPPTWSASTSSARARRTRFWFPPSRNRGAFFTISSAPQTTSPRAANYIALAAMILGKWNRWER